MINLRCIAAAACWLALASAGLHAAGRTIERFDPAAYQGEMGTLVLPLKGEALLAVEDTENSRILRLSSTDGSFRLPVGKFTLITYVAFAADGNQDKWAISGNLEEAKGREVTVAANATQDLALGPPFTASVAVTRHGEEADFAFKLAGRGGDLCTIRKTTASTDPPGFEVVSPGGQVVWQGSFRFG